jgi:uncharacterized protein (TIGR02466 family)
MYTLNLFPKVVYVEHSTDNLNMENIREVALSQEYRSMITHGNEVSVNNNVLDEILLLDLKKHINKHLGIYTKEVMKYNAEFYVTQSWLLKNKTGVDTYNHYHPNSFISGTFYIQNDANINLMFHNDTIPMIDPPKTSMTIENSGTWFAPSINGTLLLFPSNLRHSTMSNMFSNDRIVLSFNVFIKSVLGNVNSLDYLDLTKLG